MDLKTELQRIGKVEMIQLSRATKSNVIAIEHNRTCRIHDRTVRSNKEVATVRWDVGDVKEALGFH